MKYNILGKTGIKVSQIGFGAMRLPVDNQKECDNIIRCAYDYGINYFDTAPYYCNNMSETALGHGLKEFRHDITIATKIPLHQAENKADVRGWIERSLKALDTDYIDIYQIWSHSRQAYEELCIEKDFLSVLEDAKKEGLIRHISYSFHTTPEDMKYLTDNTAFESALVNYNVYDRSRRKEIDYAKAHGIGLIDMGALSVPGHKEQEEFRRRAETAGLNPYQTALKFVLDNNSFDSILSSFSSVNRVQDTAEFLCGDTSLSKIEIELIESTEQNPTV